MLMYERVRMKSVLIIEDNKEIALQMEKYLVNNGYEVEIASSLRSKLYYECRHGCGTIRHKSTR